MTQENYMSWGGDVCEVWEDPARGSRLVLQQILAWANTSPPVQKCLVQGVLSGSKQRPVPTIGRPDGGGKQQQPRTGVLTTKHWYRCARDGDHLMGVPFECNLCTFRNVNERGPVWRNRKDQFTLTCIRRVQLDVMWARESHMVEMSWTRSKADFKMVTENLSVRPELVLPQLGNAELKDRVGMTIALTMLLTSLWPGRNSAFIQWDMMRKTQTWYSNAHEAGRGYTCDTVLDLDNVKQYVSNSPAHGKWFS
jgi:hypothetical protein